MLNKNKHRLAALFKHRKSAAYNCRRVKQSTEVHYGHHRYLHVFIYLYICRFIFFSFIRLMIWAHVSMGTSSMLLPWLVVVFVVRPGFSEADRLRMCLVQPLVLY